MRTKTSSLVDLVRANIDVVYIIIISHFLTTQYTRGENLIRAIVCIWLMPKPTAINTFKLSHALFSPHYYKPNPLTLTNTMPTNSNLP